MRNNTRAFTELISFFKFLNNFFTCVSNTTLLQRVTKALFNFPLLKILQPRILDFAINPSAARTSLQYLLLFLEHTNSKLLGSLVSRFVFGFGKQLSCGVMKEMYGDTEDSSVDIPPESKSLCDINFGETVDKPNISVIALSELLEDAKESSSFLFETTSSFKEEGKENPKASKAEDLGLNEIINIDEYAVESHDAATITSFVISSINYERGCYSIISLQLIDKLLSFSIKEVYDLLVFNGIKEPLTSYERKTVEQIAAVFPNSKLLTAPTKSTPSAAAYHGLNVLLSDYSSPKEAAKQRSGSCDLSRPTLIPPSEVLLRPVTTKELFNPNIFLNKSAGKLNVDPAGTENVFIDAILKKAGKLLYNSFDENLFLASILLKLFAIPLDEISVGLEVVLLEGEGSAIGLLKRNVEEAVNAMENQPKLVEMVKRRKEVRKKGAASTMTPVRGENAKSERFIDVASPCYW
eukprot:TRINITY_DN7069_c0_g4_i10.p1 TRINITY_DN7069_c0_g4~~TRINITY_DN7069_c0_g4_i10.p1  ORF type:complete len:466 (+),score=115.87 TRINITY_DN7069_c0_g4_i10:113-1510(+)